MIEVAPIKFTPYLKSVIWGGDKICRYKGIEQPEPNIGESWELSAVPGHESVVEDGSYKGLTINDLIERFGKDLLGERVVMRHGNKFPLLIKFIDANDNLSVQVHPDDKLAQKRHNCPGKTEMWYIIKSEKNARIYAGLNSQLSPELYVETVNDGTFASKLKVHDSAPGDVYFLPAGMVHAIGAGNLLAEIQQSSDITYRIYDYDRKDATGQPRELHTDLAKDAIDYDLSEDSTPANYNDDLSDSEIVSCDYFVTRRVNVNSNKTVLLDNTSFSIVMCIEGSVVIHYPEGQMNLDAGHTCLIPAMLPILTLEGNATILITQV